MNFLTSKSLKAWAPVIVIALIIIIALLLVGGSKKAVAPGETATTTEEDAKGEVTTPAPTTPSSPVSIGGIKSTTYVPTGWSLKFKLATDWRVQPQRADDGTVTFATIGTPTDFMSVAKDKPFAKPSLKTPVISTRTILGEEVEVATYDKKNYFTVRHDGDNYYFSVEGALDAFIASIQVAG